MSATPESGDAPLAVQFNTFNVGTYLWDFRDGTTSTEQNPLHVFANPDVGTMKVYNVVLTVTQLFGPSATSHNVHVKNGFTTIDPDDLPTWAFVLLIVFGIIIFLFLMYFAFQHGGHHYFGNLDFHHLFH